MRLVLETRRSLRVGARVEVEGTELPGSVGWGRAGSGGPAPLPQGGYRPPAPARWWRRGRPPALVLEMSRVGCCRAGSPRPPSGPASFWEGLALYLCSPLPSLSSLASPRSGPDVPLSRNSSYLVNQSLQGVSDKAIWFSAELGRGRSENKRLSPPPSLSPRAWDARRPGSRPARPL